MRIPFKLAIYCIFIASTSLIAQVPDQTLATNGTEGIWVFKHSVKKQEFKLKPGVRLSISYLTTSGKWGKLRCQFKGMTDNTLLLLSKNQTIISLPKERIQKIRVFQFRSRKFWTGVILLLSFPLLGILAVSSGPVGEVLGLLAIAIFFVGIIKILGSWTGAIHDPFGGSWFIIHQTLP